MMQNIFNSFKSIYKASIKESAGSIVLKVNGVVLIETPYFGTNDKGPSLISLMPFSISIQNMRFSILSQYSPNVS